MAEKRIQGNNRLDLPSKGRAYFDGPFGINSSNLPIIDEGDNQFNLTLNQEGITSLAPNVIVKPAPPTKSVQFNEDDEFGGTPDFVYDYYVENVGIGTYDPTIKTQIFNELGFNDDGTIYTIVPSGSNHIYVGGNFERYIGKEYNNIIKLDLSGSVDTSFNIGKGFNGPVYAITLKDDKLYVGGDFTTYSGSSNVNRIVRLNSNGTIDNTFNTNEGFDNTVYSILLSTITNDDAIFVGGNFTKYSNNFNSNKIIKITGSGTIDPTFNPNGGFDADPSSSIYSIVHNFANPTYLYVAGKFTNYSGSSDYQYGNSGILKISSSGQVDTSFNQSSSIAGGTSGSIVYTIYHPNANDLYIGGNFTKYSGSTVSKVTKLNKDTGQLEWLGSFPTLSGGGVRTIHFVSSSNYILIGGLFSISAGDGTVQKLTLLNSANGSLIGNNIAGRTLIGGGDVYTSAVLNNTASIIGGDFKQYRPNFVLGQVNPIQLVNCDKIIIVETPSLYPQTSSYSSFFSFDYRNRDSFFISTSLGVFKTISSSHNTSLVVKNSGYVGFNTGSPDSAFHLYYGEGPLMRIDSAYSSSILFVTSSGIVGVMTGLPNGNENVRLHVSGAIRAHLSESSTQYVITYNTSSGLFTYFTASGVGGPTSPAPPTKSVQFNEDDEFGGTSDFVYDYKQDILPYGAVGIGIYDPTAKLHVSGTFQQGGDGVVASGTGSHAQGKDTLASGDYSHAEGRETIAYGEYSHTEGWGTIAPGFYSHAEGYYTTASDYYSHAEGILTIASGQGSHAEGWRTTASGIYSHAEGILTIASGQGSHAEGNQTRATGVASHAEGYSTTASNYYSHAEGQYTIASGHTSHAEGGGTIASGYTSHAEGGGTIAQGAGSHAEGYSTTASGDYSHAEGLFTTATNTGSHAEGYYTIASGSYSHAEGSSSIARGFYSHAEGNSTTAFGTSSHAEGSNTTAYGDYSHAEGYLTIASGSYSHAEGLLTTASGLYSHTEGTLTKAIGIGSHAEGTLTLALGGYSHAEGQYTTASGIISHAEGYKTIASGYASHAEGWNTTASDDFSHAEGFLTIASGYASHAEGSSSVAFGLYSHAEGFTTIASGIGSHAEGYLTIASGSFSHAEGDRTIASNYASHAEGLLTTASGQYSHAAGNTTIAQGDYQSVIGQFNLPMGTPGSFIIGRGSLGSQKNLVYTSGSHFEITGSLYLTESRNISQQHLLMYDTASGEVTYFTASGTGGGGGGTPASPNKSIQYNNAGAFGGSGNFTWDNAISTFNVTGSTIISSSQATQLQVGTNSLFVSSSTNVGIGTISPIAKLHISGANNQPLLRVSSPASSSILFVSGSGNVGVGTATPNGVIEVVEGGSSRIIVTTDSGFVGLQQSSPAEYVHITSDPANTKWIQIDATSTHAPPTTVIAPSTGYGNTANKIYLAEPDYWMEIKLNGNIVLIPCYSPG